MSADPDRFINFGTPGAQEWWYFDAVSRDRRDVLVLIWFAGLPFDPAYGTAAIRHLKNPSRYPAPDPLDHCAINVNWYRDGKLIAYALNAYRRGAFEHKAEPFELDVAGNRITRDEGGYGLTFRTPALGGGVLEGSLRFGQEGGLEPVERELGSAESPHRWILILPDSHVTGRVARTGQREQGILFEGTGYHDHNAGAEEMSMAMRRWRWGRVSDGSETMVYYHAEPREGRERGLLVRFRGGEIVGLDEGPRFEERGGRAGNVYGVRHGRELEVVAEGMRLRDRREDCVDDGPFYRRWATAMEVGAAGQGRTGYGVSELLDTRNLNSRLFNWMIPYRLKRPSTEERP